MGVSVSVDGSGGGSSSGGGRYKAATSEVSSAVEDFMLGRTVKRKDTVGLDEIGHL